MPLQRTCSWSVTLNSTLTLHYIKRAATNFAAWWTEAQWVWAVCLRLLPDSITTAIWTRAFCAWVQHANHSAIEPPYVATLTFNLLYLRRTRSLYFVPCCSFTNQALAFTREVSAVLHGWGFSYGVCSEIPLEICSCLLFTSFKRNLKPYYCHCLHNMQSRIYETVVHLSVCPIDQQQQRWPSGLLLSTLLSLGRRYWSTAVCTEAAYQLQVCSAAMRHSMAVSCKCGQCHIDSRGTRLNTDLFVCVFP